MIPKEIKYNLHFDDVQSPHVMNRDQGIQPEQHLQAFVYH